MWDISKNNFHQGGPHNTIELDSSVSNKHARPKSTSRLWRIEESHLESEVFSERGGRNHDERKH